MANLPYTKEHRLQDILSLIQILSYSPKTRRTNDGLTAELKRSPSKGDWIELAKEHPEFFRVREDDKKPSHISLIARNAQESILDDDGDSVKPALSADVANKLMELAIELHNKDTQRKHLWKATVLPILVAAIAATAAVTSAIINALAHVNGGS